MRTILINHVALAIFADIVFPMSCIIRCSVAAVLASSAAMKTWELWVVTSIHLGTLVLPRWLSIGSVGMESLLAGLLAIGVWPQWLYRLGMMLFTFFAGITAWLTVIGADSCGCFGRLALPPWITFCIDLAAAAGMARNLYNLPSTHSLLSGTANISRRCATVAVIALALMTVITLAVHRPDMGTLADEDDIVAGQRLEAAGAEGSDDGVWMVVCYRNTCPHCTTYMGNWLERIRHDQVDTSRKWAFLNVDDDKESWDLLDRYPHNSVKRWKKPMPFLTTPLVLVMRGGMVEKTYESVDDVFGGSSSR